MESVEAKKAKVTLCSAKEAGRHLKLCPLQGSVFSMLRVGRATPERDKVQGFRRCGPSKHKALQIWRASFSLPTTPQPRCTASMDRLFSKRALQITGSVLRSPTTARSTIRATATARSVSTVLRIAEPSFWTGLIPKPLRRENRSVPDATAPKKKSWLAREWNPATFFAIVFLLIGSMSIQMIGLRKTFDAHTRRSDVRIGLLREVVEKLQAGEEVDVEKALGSGNPEKEAMWDEGRSHGNHYTSRITDC